MTAPTTPSPDYVLVPVELTADMLATLCAYTMSDPPVIVLAWAALLAARPPIPTGPEKGGETPADVAEIVAGLRRKSAATVKFYNGINVYGDRKLDEAADTLVRMARERDERVTLALRRLERISDLQRCIRRIRDSVGAGWKTKQACDLALLGEEKAEAVLASRPVPGQGKATGEQIEVAWERLYKNWYGSDDEYFPTKEDLEAAINAALSVAAPAPASSDDNQAQFDMIQAALENPAPPTPALRELFREAALQQAAPASPTKATPEQIEAGRRAVLDNFQWAAGADEIACIVNAAQAVGAPASPPEPETQTFSYADKDSEVHITLGKKAFAWPRPIPVGTEDATAALAKWLAEFAEDDFGAGRSFWMSTARNMLAKAEAGPVSPGLREALAEAEKARDDLMQSLRTTAELHGDINDDDPIMVKAGDVRALNQAITSALAATADKGPAPPPSSGDDL